MIGPGTAADLQRRQMEALRERAGRMAEARISDTALADCLKQAERIESAFPFGEVNLMATDARMLLYELQAARAELALLRAEQQRLEDTLRLAELALAAVVTMFEVPVSFMGGEAFSVDGAAVNQARMVLVKVNQERECRAARRQRCASGWQAPGEGEVAG